MLFNKLPPTACQCLASGERKSTTGDAGSHLCQPVKGTCLFALALFDRIGLSRPRTHEIGRRRDASPAGARLVHAVILPNPAKSCFKLRDGEISAHRCRCSKTKCQNADGKNRTLHCNLPLLPGVSDSACSISRQAHRARSDE